MSMSPERIEEKKRLHDYKHPHCVALVTVGEFNSLLAALEEEKRASKRVLESHYYVEGKLKEAQQTIAQQQVREPSTIYEVSEIHKEAAAGNNGSLDRADTALKRIMLLSSKL